MIRPDTQFLGYLAEGTIVTPELINELKCRAARQPFDLDLKANQAPAAYIASTYVAPESDPA